jgi:8-oxo-dGTP pyrophosphatase MutT (NUDIX family)
MNTSQNRGGASPNVIAALREMLLPIDTADRETVPQARAAVLIPLVADGSDLSVVYIRRADSISLHGGQVAFPGGKREASDATLAAAALRESFEEVNLDPTRVDLLGAFPPMRTATTGMLVAPFIGSIPAGLPLRPAPQEVAEIFSVPIGVLRDPARRVLHEFRRDGLTWKFPAIDCNGRPLWGLTYRITLALIDVLEGKRTLPLA